MRSRAVKGRIVALILAASMLSHGCTIAGITIDPDLTFRAFLSATSDLAVFLLENAAATAF